jgi:hypothetical protein
MANGSEVTATDDRDFDLGLDWDDIGEAYLGSLAALLTLFAFFMLVYGRRMGRRRR